MDVIKVLLTAVNAKFIHTNLAIRTLKGYLLEHSSVSDIELAEFTINQHMEIILREIYRRKPQVLGFSCYIWNIDIIARLVRELKKLLPETFIFLGGPEVSFEPQNAIDSTGCDCVITGEGESAITELTNALAGGGTVPKIIFGTPVLLDDIPFPYENLNGLENRIIYYESSRGCPFSCSYCLSSGSSGVRLLSLDRVFSDLKFFLDNSVPQVKFTDRTFNCDKERSLAIWKFLSEHDNKITNFHFEMAAELIDSETLDFLSTVRKGLFQFEIGVQSTNPDTLKAISRITLPDRLTPVINRLHEKGNIHLHLDLIAGLPYEGYDEFKASFNYVYSLRPHQLQLGFLKLLSGSRLKEDNFDIVCLDYPPYEVIFTKWLSHDELLRLKNVEEMVEKYYNSGRFNKSIGYLESFFETPFDFFQELGDYFYSKNYHLKLLNKNDDYEVLFEFAGGFCNAEKIRSYCLYDMYLHEKVKKMPDFLVKETRKNKVFEFLSVEENRRKYCGDYADYDIRQLLRAVHIEFFDFNPQTGEEKPTAILFRYKNNPPADITEEIGNI